MRDIELDISPLGKAVDRLQEGLLRYQQDITDTQIRDGLIQRFEFTYEISHKLVRALPGVPKPILTWILPSLLMTQFRLPQWLILEMPLQSLTCLGR